MPQEPRSRTGSQPHFLAWVLAFAMVGWTSICATFVLGGTLAVAWWGDISKIAISQQTILTLGLILLPLVGTPLLLGFFVRAPRPRAIFETLALALLAGILIQLPRALFPPTASYLPPLLRAGLGFLAAAIIFKKAPKAALPTSRRQRMTSLGWALLVGWSFLVPWLTYGALGDGWDILVACIQALSLAFLAVSLSAFLLPKLEGHGDSSRRTLFLGGITLTTAYLILGGSWGQMDYQFLLMGVLPALAFPLALLGIKAMRYPALSGVIMVWLGIFGPLAFFDPIELNLYNLLSQEAAKWASLALLWNLAWGMLLFLISLIFAKKLLRPQLTPVWSGLATFTAILAVVVYLLGGNPGMYGDDFFVVMTSQADVSPALKIRDIHERRAWVYRTLVAHADREQADLISWLDDHNIPYTRYYLTNGIEVHASPLRRWQIAQRKDVKSILYSPELRPLPRLPALEGGDAPPPQEPTWGLEALQAPRVWEEFGVRGEGITIGQSDTGVDVTHPALAKNYRGKLSGNDYHWLDPWYHRPEPYDLSGHGTHTLSTVVGAPFTGIAPEATWFACANLVRSFGSPAYYLTCMQFMLAPWPQNGDPFKDGRPELAADISTNSWGCPPRLEGCDQEVLWPAVKAFRAAGIFFVVAAGNEGPACNSEQTPPGNYSNTALTVGAMTPTGDLAIFSSRGPKTLSPDGAHGPDFIAPGVDVLGAWPGGQWKRLEGTSMATPHVAGVVALMWSANPALRGQIEATERILIQSASAYRGVHDNCGDPTERPEASFGYGVINAYDAVKRARAWRP